MAIALIDNYDSFTYNLVQFLGELGADIKVFRNDKVTLPELVALAPTHLEISPRPVDMAMWVGASAISSRSVTLSLRKTLLSAPSPPTNRTRIYVKESYLSMRASASLV